jgi:hypothetical protein
MLMALCNRGADCARPITEQTREAIDCYIGAADKKPGEYLFGGRPLAVVAGGIDL